jgi:hypothetical protein
MRVYHCNYHYFGGFAGEPEPRWPQDYALAGDLAQGALQGGEALEEAFRRQVGGRGLRLGDVVALADGNLHRCEMAGWTHIGRLWRARLEPDRTERQR